MEESQNVPWYADRKFAKYWRHCESVSSWFRCHMQAASMRAQSNLHQEMRWHELMHTYQSQMSWWHTFYAGCHGRPLYDGDDYYKWNTPMTPDGSTDDMVFPSTVENTYSHSSHSSHHKRGKRHKKLSKKRKRESSHSKDDASPLTFELQSTDDNEYVEYEMEITEEMLEFFAQSAKYKVERGNLKSKILFK